MKEAGKRLVEIDSKLNDEFFRNVNSIKRGTFNDTVVAQN